MGHQQVLHRQLVFVVHDYNRGVSVASKQGKKEMSTQHLFHHDTDCHTVSHYWACIALDQWWYV